MTFSKPPIVEAIFHLVVERDSDFEREVLNEYAKYITQTFPIFNQEEKRFLKNEITVKLDDLDNITSSVTNILEGYKLSSNDRAKVIQANTSSFSFSKLHPYETWDIFYEEANKFWEKYVETTSATRVKRLSLRYLNRIMIPFEKKVIQLHDYIKVFPEVSDDLSMIISGYFMQISLASMTYQPSQAIVNQTVGSEEVGGTNGDSTFIPLIFDVEVFQDVDLDVRDSSINSIFVDNLRPFKNDIFFNSITEKSQEFFQ
ncbi:TIGR04255 family protein [Chamaesiphon sp. OTE_8_metabat_110]|uniref:TIGR04255 family protein n=1 Tax=Chamaesiphon sp. OTE_8_metabat_110 TaxID=2964696 RepID=UPI00286BE2D7|nr:TIGR04255 family protein [Chamaesiphon sp. OTE_8_metabat_110]